MMREYTPITSDVKSKYEYVRSGFWRDDPRPFSEEFDRWLNEERAKVWDELRSEIRMLPSWYNPETGKGGFDLQPLDPDASSEEGAWNAVMEILDENPYRKEKP